MVSYLTIVTNENVFNVLILVVMEDGLVQVKRTFHAKGTQRVLILVVMEDGLVLVFIRLY